MQENNFERILQQKMSSLQVEPDEGVWQKVKEQVKKEKRRRGGMIFLLLLFLSLLGSFALTKMGQHDNKAPLAAKQDGGNLLAGNNGEKINELINSGNKTEQTGNKISGSQYDHPGTQAIAGVQEDNSTTKNKNREYTGIKKKIRPKAKAVVAASLPENNTGEEVTVEASSQKQEPEVDTVEEVKSTLAIEKKNIPELKDIVKPADNNDSASKKSKPEQNKKHLWSIAFTFSAGRSSTNEGLIKEKSLGNSDYSAGVPTTGTGSGIGNSGNYYSPSVPEAGLGFSAGIVLYRQLSGKIKMSTGIRYQLLTTSIKTGNKSDSLSQVLSNRVYQYGNANAHTNYYHLATVPFSLSAAVFNIGKKEINMEAGVDFSKLFATNSLHFNTSQGIYYENKSAFNNFFIGLSASAGINLAGKNEKAFIIGPEFYYSLTQLAASGINAGKHFNFIGLRLQKKFAK